MEFLDVSHNTALVIASIVVAFIAGFTGLTLSKDLSKQSVLRRKASIAMSAVALGGGIWSMHFVAMLGMQMPILFYYDAAITLASALLAILIVGTALLLLHFRQRTAFHLVCGRRVGWIWNSGDALCGHGRSAIVPRGLYTFGYHYGRGVCCLACVLPRSGLRMVNVQIAIFYLERCALGPQSALFILLPWLGPILSLFRL